MKKNNRVEQTFEGVKSILYPDEKNTSAEIQKEFAENGTMLHKTIGFSPGPNQFVVLPRSVITVESSGLVQTEVAFDAASSDEQSTAKKAGATVLTGKDNLLLPVFGSNSYALVGENEEGPDAPDVTSIPFTPLRIAGEKAVSGLFFLDRNAPLGKAYIQKAYTFMDKTLDAAVFGTQARSATTPQGLGYAITTGGSSKAAAVIPSWDTILSLEYTVGAAEALRGKLAYITSPAGAKILKSIYRDAGNGRFIMEDGKINGYPVFICDQVTDACGTGLDGSLLIFGAWQDLAIRDYGIVVTVDPYSHAIENKVALHFNWFLDVRGLNGESSTGEETDNFEYAKSFAAVAIKAQS